MAKVALVDHSFKAHLDGYKYPERYGNRQAFYRDAGMEILHTFDSACAQQGFLAGNKFSLIDAAIFPFVRQFAAVDPLWFEAQSVSSLRAWMGNISNSTLFETVMESHPVWVP
jgi:glutathione S-transferase